MARPPSGFLLDLLAPCLFRPTSIARPTASGRRLVAGVSQLPERRSGVRGSATAAKAQVRSGEEDEEGGSETGHARQEGRAERAWLGGRDREDGPGPVAGPSRWSGALDVRPEPAKSATPCKMRPLSVDRADPDNASWLGIADGVENRSYKYRRPAVVARAECRASGTSALSTVLSQPNPPRPSSLLPLLSSGASRTDGDLLSRYSRRMDDATTDAAVQDMMGRMRLAPLGWITPARARRKRRAAPRIPADPGRSGDDATQTGNQPDIPRRSLPAHLHDLRKRSNAWARNMWPPRYRPDRANERYVDPNVYLGHIHHDLLYDPQSLPTFAEALKRLSREPNTTDTHRLSLLHLYLAYPEESLAALKIPTSSTSHEHVSINRRSAEYHTQVGARAPDVPAPVVPGMEMLLQLCTSRASLRPTRQTLHLLMLSLLSSTRAKPLSGEDPSSELVPTTTHETTRSASTALISYFSARWGFGPGCETWRHITRAALQADDKGWAREAWRGWWSARERVTRRAGAFLEPDLNAYPLELDQAAQAIEGVATDHGPPSRIEDGQRATEEEGSGYPDTHSPDNDASQQPDPEGNPTVENAIFRFEHRGKQLTRWIRTIRSLEKKGWIKRVIRSDGSCRSPMGQRDAWTWADRQGDS